MLEKPCKLHLTLLTTTERCPVCGHAAGDHPTHPSNKRPPVYGETSQPCAEVARLKRERNDMRRALVLMLSRLGYGAVVRFNEAAVAGNEGDVCLSMTDDAKVYELRFVPSEPPTVCHHSVRGDYANEQSICGPCSQHWHASAQTR